MKLIRYLDKQGISGFASLQGDGLAQRLVGDIYKSPRPMGESVDVVKLLAPIEPTAIICIGLNYRQHAKEICGKRPEHPEVFFKGVIAIQNSGDPILLPTHLKSDEVDYKCELAAIIGRVCKNLSRSKALDCVFGYTCCNDVSARDWQITRGGGQWCSGKSLDTFAPMGPCVVTCDEIPNSNTLFLRTILNGVVTQDSNSSDMIFDATELIEFFSGSMTLLLGTVILTGTPHRVGMAVKTPRRLRPGDSVSALKLKKSVDS